MIITQILKLPEKIHTGLWWQISDNYVDLSDLFVDSSVIYVDLSDHYVDLFEKIYAQLIAKYLVLYRTAIYLSK